MAPFIKHVRCSTPVPVTDDLEACAPDIQKSRIEGDDRNPVTLLHYLAETASNCYGFENIASFIGLYAELIEYYEGDSPRQCEKQNWETLTAGIDALAHIEDAYSKRMAIFGIFEPIENFSYEFDGRTSDLFVRTVALMTILVVDEIHKLHFEKSIYHIADLKSILGRLFAALDFLQTISCDGHMYIRMIEMTGRAAAAWSTCGQFLGEYLRRALVSLVDLGWQLTGDGLDDLGRAIEVMHASRMQHGFDTANWLHRMMTVCEVSCRTSLTIKIVLVERMVTLMDEPNVQVAEAVLEVLPMVENASSCFLPFQRSRPIVQLFRALYTRYTEELSLDITEGLAMGKLLEDNVLASDRFVALIKAQVEVMRPIFQSIVSAQREAEARRLLMLP